MTPVLSDFYLWAHERRGTTVLLNTTAARIHGTADRAEAVVLDDGRELSADLVVIGIGAAAAHRPRDVARARRGAARHRRRPPGPDLGRRHGRRRRLHRRTQPLRARTRRSASASRAWRTRPTRHAWRRRPSSATRRHTPRCRGSGATRATCDCRSPGSPTAPTSSSCEASSARSPSRCSPTATGLLIAIEAIGASGDYVVVKRALERGMTISPEVAADPTVPLRRGLQTVDTSHDGTASDSLQSRPTS